jgi:hypothetical protein
LGHPEDAVRPPIAIAPGERQVWRIVNASPDLYADLKIDAEQIEIVALDGMPLAFHNPTHRVEFKSHVLVPPAGRVEAIVTGSKPGARASLRTLCFDTGRDGDPNPAMTAVAGDLYDFPPASPDCIAVFVADVVGHGVPAALVAAMIKVVVSRPCEQNGEPAMVIAGLNAILCGEAREQYATAVYLCLDTVSGVGRYSAAAHPPPLLWRRGKQSLEVLGETGLLLGVRPKEAYADSEFSFEMGDRLLRQCALAHSRTD